MSTLPATVLIVEDDALLRRALETVLERIGYRVLSTGNPDTAYELLATEPVDAALLDVRLPTMSGLALYLAITHRWPALHGRIALMTGNVAAPEVRSWIERNRSPVFQKPFRGELIAGWLSAVLDSRERRTREA